MNHREAEITEMVIVLSKTCEDRLPQVLKTLADAGVEVLSTDEENLVVSATVETYKLPAVEKLEGVNYVRQVQTYIADYPDGDPRNTDGPDDEGSEED